MRDLKTLLALPASILLSVLLPGADAHEQEWPYNLPRSVRYYPEDEWHVKRGLEAQQKLAWESPVGLKKLGHDPGEKFFLHYWQFEGALEEDGIGEHMTEQDPDVRRLIYHQQLGPCGNASKLLPALSRHLDYKDGNGLLFGRSLFARDFQCPAGTQSCSNVGSDLCCKAGETCVNTSRGIGCCPYGASCGEDVGGCDTATGYTACPNDDKGGCCIPGASCVEDGCAYYGTATVVTTLPAPTPTSSQNPPTIYQPLPTTIVVSESGFTTTVTVTASAGASTGTVTITQPTTIVVGVSTSRSCTSGFQSCPATLGGGCCRSGQICGTDQGCLDVTSTSTATAVPPVRPTSSDESASKASNPTTEGPSETGAASCPTGFYMCSAVYLGGCCRVDRNCDTTSCPPATRTDAVKSNGITVSAGAAATTGSCANGWRSCGADVGGGCCPAGYLCSSNCVNPAAGGSNTTKQAPSTAAVTGVGWSFVGAGMVAAIGMVWL